MKNVQILTLVGGISRNSLNKKLFEAVRDRAPKGYHLVNYDISKLPFYSQDLEMDPPDLVTEFKEKIREAAAVLLITPEYNRSFPGVLKNAIDWGSRPFGQNLWEKKPAAVMGASIGSVGTFGAQNHLRQVCVYVDMPVMTQPEFYFQAASAFDGLGKLNDLTTETLLKIYWESFVEWIDLTGEKRHVLEVPIENAKGQEDSPFAH